MGLQTTGGSGGALEHALARDLEHTRALYGCLGGGEIGKQAAAGGFDGW